MILNLRGTSGSGKSTIVRSILESARKTMAVLPIHSSGRKRPWGYLLHPNHGSGVPTFIVGHYETACGGCDTITSLEKVFDLVHTNANAGYHVLFEGIMVSGERVRTIELNKSGHPVRVIALAVSLEDCIQGVKTRRAERGDTSPFDTDRTIRRYHEVTRMMEHLKIGGVSTVWLTREQALSDCYRLLGVPNA